MVQFSWPPSPVYPSRVDYIGGKSTVLNRMVIWWLVCGLCSLEAQHCILISSNCRSSCKFTCQSSDVTFNLNLHWPFMRNVHKMPSSTSASATTVTKWKWFFFNISTTTKARSFNIYHHGPRDPYISTRNDVTTSYFRSAEHRINVLISGHVQCDFWTVVQPISKRFTALDVAWWPSGSALDSYPDSPRFESCSRHMRHCVLPASR